MFSLKTQWKLKKAQWKEFSLREYMSRRRYLGRYPKLKNFVLINFLFVVVAFVGWNMSLNLPQVSFKWSSDPIVIENHAQAKFKASDAIIEVKEIEITDCYTAADVMGKKYEVNPDLLKKIMKAESANNNKAANKGSTARGCAQWIIGSWETYGKTLWGDEFYTKNVYSPKDSVELMSWVISKYGTSPWDASRAVWGK